MKVLFLVSGGGGNLKFLFLAAQIGVVKRIRLFAVSDRECAAHSFAKNNGLCPLQIRYDRHAANGLAEALREIEPDYIITNWHKIIDPCTTKKYAGKMINLHYSLLPAFSGLIGMKTIENAYLSGCKYIGPTCHYVDEGVDTGKIISQAVFEVEEEKQASVTKMFRSGCLVLLQGLLIASKDSSICAESTLKKRDCGGAMFSPKISFPIDQFDEVFWRHVAEL